MSNPPDRRTFLKQALIASAAFPVITLFGCGQDSGALPVTTPDTSGDSDDSTTVNTTEWASGGTQNLTANFPATDLFNSASFCSVVLTKSLTEGPCYFMADVLDDISEGQSGLPSQLCLQVIDANCQPQANLEIEVWHCNVNGLYSGNTEQSADAGRFAGGFCTGNDSQAVQAKWFRGTAITDSDGRVNFKTCFPGWYSSRTIHIHFRVKNNNRDQVISQFCFNDALTKAICTTHPDYAHRGEQDTPLSGGRDTVFGSNADEFVMDIKNNEDGSLLLYKRIIINT
ncbi:dioxygenase family protein [Pseudoalteromonas xiamenensis]